MEKSVKNNKETSKKLTTTEKAIGAGVLMSIAGTLGLSTPALSAPTLSELFCASVGGFLFGCCPVVLYDTYEKCTQNEDLKRQKKE